MRWFHKCSLEWLKARQSCLTATDVKDLLPVTRTGRKRTIDDEDYLKVLSRKLVNLTDADCISSGAMARGHVLEPYAIDLYNKTGRAWLYHWDDLVVTKDVHVHGGLAFSPDATTIASDSSLLLDGSVMQGGCPIREIGEVKSYSPERHLACAHMDKGDLEERWQLATAMAVNDNIEVAHLMFFNPSMHDQLFIVDYDRGDLADEIETVLEVEDGWLNWMADYGKLHFHECVREDRGNEERIIDHIIKKEELNPEGEKTVIR